ncbi:MAG: hypothetical protein JOS17DRAFT_820498, partial [Linnemannia elongata]
MCEVHMTCVYWVIVCWCMCIGARRRNDGAQISFYFSAFLYFFCSSISSFFFFFFAFHASTNK